MKNTHIILFNIILGLIFLISTPIHAATGLELMQKQKELHEVSTEYTLSNMTLVDKKGRERVRELVIYAKKTPEGENRSLLKFIKPQDIHNVGLLTWQHAGATEDDQWLYLPASKRVKRIASAGKKNPFMGSDLSYEDMRTEDLDSHTYTILREEVLNGQDCWVIEALPSTKQEQRESGYARRLIWLRKDITYPVKVDFFNRRDALLKTANYQEIEQAGGTAWRYKLLSMQNMRKKTSTLMRIQKRLIGVEINENKFNQQVLRRPVEIK